MNERAKPHDRMMEFWLPRSQSMQVRSLDYILSYFCKTLKVFKPEVALPELPLQKSVWLQCGEGIDEAKSERKEIKKLFH